MLGWRTAAIALLLVSIMVQPASAASPESFVARSQAQFDAMRAGTVSRQTGCTRYVAAAFDLSYLTQVVADRHWGQFGATLRSQLTSAVSTRMVNECIGLLDRPERGPAIVRRVRSVSGTVRVTAQLQDSGTVFIWTLRPGGAWGYEALDLVVDGHSLGGTLRDEFENQLTAHEGNVKLAIANLARMHW